VSSSDFEIWRAAFRSHLAQTSPEPIGVVVDRAEGPWVVSPDGRRYLDLLSGLGVANVGHVHPRVLAAVDRQVRRHHHVMVYGEYVQEEQALYAADLASVTPPGLDRVYFVNSGAEAVEGALKTARKHTGRTGFVAFEGAYHGDTTGALSLIGNPRYKAPFEPLLGSVTLLPFGDERALEAVNETTAAAVIEPVQGEGGVRPVPDGFLEALARRCREVGALLVLDEVMTGFGRTGRLFACERWGVVPDLLVLGKALGGGFPLGAFIGPSRILSTLSHDPPLSHVTTFGGHPVSCAAGRAALQVLLEEDLPERAERVGSWWRETLREALPVKEVRGLGMFVGIELESAERTRSFTDRCRARGLLVGWTLHHDHVVRLAPPLTTPEEILLESVSVMERALAEA